MMEAEPTYCDRCNDINLECHALPFVHRIRVLYFRDFASWRLVLGKIEECDQYKSHNSLTLSR